MIRSTIEGANIKACIRWPRYRKKGCLWKATWVIGTAAVPYCEHCASLYPQKVGKEYIARHRIAQPDSNPIEVAHSK